MEYKALISFIVIGITLAGYIPYILDILKGKTTPHIFTWFTVTLTAFLAYSLQVLGGAGVGAWPMLTVATICLIIFILSFWRGTKDITKSDVACLLFALLAIFFWLVTDQPILSVIFVTFGEIFGYIPTIRKSWNKPYSETLIFYEITSLRHGFSVLALEKLNMLTVLYPATWALVNLTIATILIMRRRKIPQEQR